MKKKLMEFILKDVGEEKENMHFIMYGDFLTERSDYEEINEPEFYNVIIRKVTDGKEKAWRSKSVTFSGHKMTNIDCAEQALASIICNDNDVEVIYLDAEVETLVRQYIEKTAFEFQGRKISKYHYNATLGACKLYLATDKFLYYEKYGASIMLSTDDGHAVSDNTFFSEIGLEESFRAIEDGKEKILYGEIPEDYIAYC